MNHMSIDPDLGEPAGHVNPHGDDPFATIKFGHDFNVARIISHDPAWLRRVGAEFARMADKLEEAQASKKREAAEAAATAAEGCRRCGNPAPAGNDLCGPCEQAEGALALAALRGASAGAPLGDEADPGLTR